MSREYEALFNEMAKTPALPAGIGRSVEHGQRPSETPSLAATMPQVINHAEEVGKRHPGAYCAMEVNNPFRCLIIVPARNEAEAASGSGILAIGRSEADAWRMAYEAL